jgi:hypothetical protein
MATGLFRSACDNLTDAASLGLERQSHRKRFNPRTLAFVRRSGFVCAFQQKRLTVRSVCVAPAAGLANAAVPGQIFSIRKISDRRFNRHVVGSAVRGSMHLLNARGARGSGARLGVELYRPPNG